MNSLMVGGVTGGALRGSRSKHGLLSQSEHVSFRLTARLHSPAAVPNGKSYHSRRFKCDLSVMKHTVIPTMEFHYVRVNRSAKRQPRSLLYAEGWVRTTAAFFDGMTRCTY
jgi:hypothetical protein